MTTPLAGWGRSTWNNGAWNQSGTVDATGVSLTSSVNDVGLVLDINVTLTGVTATASTELQIREGWNRGLNVGDSIASSFGWSNGAWGNGDNSVSVTGIALTSSQGEETVTGTASITLPSVSLTATAGDAVATGAVDATPSGIALTSSFGSLTITTDQNISVTGIGMTSSLGDESVAVTKATGWNRDTDINTGSSIGWGDQQWGAVGLSQAVTGQALTASLGDESLSTDQNISVTGLGTTSSIGTFSISGDGQTTVVAGSETAMQSSVGTAEADPEFVVFPSGNALTSTVGTVETSIFVTGVGLTSSLGDETQETIYEAPSVSAESRTGDVSVIVSVDFTPTGLSVTSSTGTLQGTFWNQVDDSNSAISWTEVHKAA
jgi:hypothetical protein